jgi:plastocyanin
LAAGCWGVGGASHGTTSSGTSTGADAAQSGTSGTGSTSQQGTSGTTGATTTGTGMGGMGMGGQGGAPLEPTAGAGGCPGATASSSSSSSTSGAGGGGGMMAPPTVNGCQQAKAVDATCKPQVAIDFGFIGGKWAYVPRCLRVKSGTKVTFQCKGEPCNFLFHTLIGGPKSKDPKSPFGTTNDVNLKSKTFVINTPGTYPYYCNAHRDQDMAGTLYVEP